jgi:hypothetical protein
MIIKFVAKAYPIRLATLVLRTVDSNHSTFIMGMYVLTLAAHDLRVKKMEAFFSN